MLLGQTPILVRSGRYWVEEETGRRDWICNYELERLANREFPYKIRVLLFDRPAKRRRAILIKIGNSRSDWFDNSLMEWRPFFLPPSSELATILPLGEHKLFFQVKRA